MLDSYQWYSNSAPLCKRKRGRGENREAKESKIEEEEIREKPGNKGRREGWGEKKRETFYKKKRKKKPKQNILKVKLKDLFPQTQT